MHLTTLVSISVSDHHTYTNLLLHTLMTTRQWQQLYS